MNDVPLPTTSTPEHASAEPPPSVQSAEMPTDTSAGIRTPDQRIRVFVSSTLDELAPERAAARSAISQLRLTPVMFELGARPYPPRDLYRAYLAQSDIFLGIYWQRYGWVAPGMEVSGLEDEEQLSNGKPRLIYLKTPAPQREPRLQALVDRVRADEVVSYQKFTTPDELREAIANDLAVLLTERFTSTIQPLQSPATEHTTSAFTRPALPPLPIPRSRLIDRSHEVATTHNLLLQADTGLVTLTGPGGVGKTRVALQAAADAAKQFADGVAFLALATVTDPQLVIPTIAQELSVAGENSRAVDERLLEFLRPKQLLLVLDNLEQLVTVAAAWIPAALAAAPLLKVLATSREPLRVRDEHVVPVAPLALPVAEDPAMPPDVERLGEAPAVALFVDRAREIQPDFTLTTQNALAVSAICQRLDGLPLAIELAVARLPVLPPGALLARLEHRLPLLSHGPRDLPTRQQTLRDTIAWSYDLLTARDQTLFRQLAVFVAGCTLDAAQAVCSLANTVADDLDVAVLEGVASLVDQSLLLAREAQDGFGGEPRFAMLETIREFAMAQLLASGEAAAVQQRHAAFFSTVAEGALLLILPDRDARLTRLEREGDNLRTALAWCTREKSQSHELEIGLQLAGHLSWYWYMQGRLEEGRRWLEDLLARADKTAEIQQSATGRLAWAKTLLQDGWLALAQGDASSAGARTEQSVSIFRVVGEKQWLGLSVMVLGMVRISQGMPSEAQLLLEESLTLFREIGGMMGQANGAFALFQLGRAAQAVSDLEGASAFYKQSLALYQQLGDTLGSAFAAYALESMVGARGDEAIAPQMLVQELLSGRRTQDRYELAQLLLDAGTASLRHGDPQRAQSLLVESLRLWHDIGARAGTARALAGLAAVAAAQGKAERAGRLFGAAKAMRPPTERLMTDASGPQIDQDVEAARAHVDAKAFAAGWDAGQALTEGQAVAEALEGAQ